MHALTLKYIYLYICMCVCLLVFVFFCFFLVKLVSFWFFALFSLFFAFFRFFFFFFFVFLFSLCFLFAFGFHFFFFLFFWGVGHGVRHIRWFGQSGRAEIWPSCVSHITKQSATAGKWTSRNWPFTCVSDIILYFWGVRQQSATWTSVRAEIWQLQLMYCFRDYDSPFCWACSTGVSAQKFGNCSWFVSEITKALFLGVFNRSATWRQVSEQKFGHCSWFVSKITKAALFGKM